MSTKKKNNTKTTKASKNAFVSNLDEDNNIDTKNLNKAKINSLPTLDYIRVTVQNEVQEGLLKLARDRPPNPIEYLGKYLLSAAKKKYK